MKQVKLDDYLRMNDIPYPEFAKKIGVSVTSLYRYVKDERLPEKPVMKRIKKETKGVVTADSFYQ